jgi:hypothetical protein
MAQSDQVVQNATFPAVRADINDNLAALYSQNSGNSAPAVTVAFQPWADTSSNPPVWKVRNGSNSAWITIGVLDPAGFNSGSVTPITNGGTGATTATAALAALLPSQSGNAGKALVTSGSAAAWGIAEGTAKAWVNFNGTGTVAIRASYNVSSITDNGVGNYTVNFTTAMVDANYSVAVSGTSTPAGGVAFAYTGVLTTSSCGVQFFGNYPSGVASSSDNSQACVAIFR